MYSAFLSSITITAIVGAIFERIAHELHIAMLKNNKKKIPPEPSLLIFKDYLPKPEEIVQARKK